MVIFTLAAAYIRSQRMKLVQILFPAGNICTCLTSISLHLVPATKWLLSVFLPLLPFPSFYQNVNCEPPCIVNVHILLLTDGNSSWFSAPGVNSSSNFSNFSSNFNKQLDSADVAKPKPWQSPLADRFLCREKNRKPLLSGANSYIGRVSWQAMFECFILGLPQVENIATNCEALDGRS